MLRISFFLIFLSCFSGFSQRFEVGAELGGNILATERQEPFGLNFKPGYHGGAFIRFALTEDFSIQSGLAFTHKRHGYSSFDTTGLPLFGLEESLPIENVDLNVYSRSRSSVDQYYLELPLMGSYELGNVKFSLGGYFAYMLFARSALEEESNVPFLQVIDIEQFDPEGLITPFLPQPYSYAFSESKSKAGLSDFDYGVRAGIGLTVGDVEVHGNYNYRLVNYRSLNSQNDPAQRHYFQLTVNYCFLKF